MGLPITPSKIIINCYMSQENFQYRKAKPAHAVMAMSNYFSLTLMYGLIGYASYVASVGYGIASALIGIILMGSRVYDGITDPLAATMIEKSHFKIGKIRIWSVIGWIIETAAVILMFCLLSGKGLGVVAFILLYLLFVSGYTIHSCAVSITASVLTNEPVQRARLGTMAIAFNILSYVFCVILIALCLLPRNNNEYSVSMLSLSCVIICAVSLLFLIIAIIGVSPYDKAENFADLERRRDNSEIKDNFGIIQVIKGNKPLRYYILSAAADGFATQVFSQSVVVTLMYGIVTGNYQFGTAVNAVAIIPALIFAFVAAKFAAKKGNRKALMAWTSQCILVAIISVVFFMAIDTRQITTNPVYLVVYIILMLSILCMRTCASSCTMAMMSDIVDYERYRSGHYIPAIISAIYSFTNKLVSSLASVLVLTVIGFVGYKDTLPQPTDPLTPGVKIATMALFYGVLIVAWGISLMAMHKYTLDKETMENIQKELSTDPVDREATYEERAKLLEEDREARRKKFSKAA